MPSYWYSVAACNLLEGVSDEEKQFLKSICVNKKPYFMTYVYDDYRSQYKNYIKQCNASALERFGKPLKQLSEDDEAEREFLRHYNAKNPFGMGPCAMNRICFYIEDEFRGHVMGLKHGSDFDYKRLKYSDAVDTEAVSRLSGLMAEYVSTLKEYKHNEFGRNTYSSSTVKARNRMAIKRHYRDAAEELVPDPEVRLDAMLDLCYGKGGNMQFFWDCAGLLLSDKLTELADDNS